MIGALAGNRERLRLRDLDRDRPRRKLLVILVEIVLWEANKGTRAEATKQNEGPLPTLRIVLEKICIGRTVLCG